MGFFNVNSPMAEIPTMSETRRSSSETKCEIAFLASWMVCGRDSDSPGEDEGASSSMNFSRRELSRYASLKWSLWLSRLAAIQAIRVPEA